MKALLFADYLERLTSLHDELKTAVHDLPPVALDWQPGPDMNSFNILITHTARSERYWIGDMIGRDPSGRVRAQEFETTGLTAVSLTTLLDETLAHSRSVLETITLADLDKAYESALHNGRSFRVAWSLAHNLEHVAIHLGHVQILRQLWDQQTAN